MLSFVIVLFLVLVPKLNPAPIPILVLNQVPNSVPVPDIIWPWSWSQCAAGSGPRFQSLYRPIFGAGLGAGQTSVATTQCLCPDHLPVPPPAVTAPPCAGVTLATSTWGVWGRWQGLVHRHPHNPSKHHDLPWLSSHDMPYHDMTWHDMTWHDMTWHDMTWHDMTWHGMTWHDMTWHDTQWPGSGRRGLLHWCSLSGGGQALLWGG